MAKRNNTIMPGSSAGGLFGGVESSYHSMYQFSPKFVILLAILVVFFIFVLFNSN